MPDIMHQLTIHAPPEPVYRALTTADGVRGWWTRDAMLDPEVGGIGKFEFYDGRTVTKIRIDEQEAPARVGWSVTSSTIMGWNGTVIGFDLRADGDNTVLSFAHRDWAEANETYARVTTGWAYFLVSLRQYIETGTGAPHPDVDFFRIIKKEG